VTAPTPLNLKVWVNFNFYHCPEQNILLKIEIQMAVRLSVFWFTKIKERLSELLLKGDSLFLFSIYHNGGKSKNTLN
jgi:hypothetical protein